jgi:hypothetical protein
VTCLCVSGSRVTEAGTRGVGRISEAVDRPVYVHKSPSRVSWCFSGNPSLSSLSREYCALKNDYLVLTLAGLAGSLRVRKTDRLQFAIPAVSSSRMVDRVFDC